MKKWKSILSIVTFLVVTFLFVRPSYATVEAYLVGGISSGNESVTSTPALVSITTTGKTGSTYGALVNLDAPASSWGLTTGLLYTEILFHQTNLSAFTDADTKLPYLQIPVLLDYWIIPLVGVGAGIYYGVPNGNVTYSGTAPTGSTSFSNAGYKNDDYGLALHAQVRIPIIVLLYLTGTAIYEYGLENTSSNSGYTTHNSSMLLAAGVGLGF